MGRDLRARFGPPQPDPFRVGDMLGELVQDAQETLYIAHTGTDVWEDFPKQVPLRRSQAYTRAVLSANRWGKSDWGARECRYFLLGDHPFFPERITLPTTGWAVSDTLDNGRLITIPKLMRHLPYDSVRHYPTVNQKWFEMRNGSLLHLKSCEQGRGAFQGTGDDFHWWDDIEGKNPDLAWECFKEGGMRIQAGRPLWQWITMTPVCGLTPLIEHLLDLRAKGDAYLIQGSIYDNPHLDEDARRRALSGVTEEWERKAREFGEVTLSGGNYLFDVALAQRMTAKPEPAFQWTSVFRDPTDGTLHLAPSEVPGKPDHTVWKIWERPQPLHRYVLFVDPAGGILSAKPDDTVIKILDVGTMSEVACLRSKLSPKPTAKQAKWMAAAYNFALLGVEANALGLGVLDELKLYPRVYHRHNVADANPKQGAKLGWHTSDVLKEKMISNLSELVSDGDILLREKATWAEMLHFIRFPNNTIGARGQHTDDGIMAAAGCVQLMLSPQLNAYFAALQSWMEDAKEAPDE